MEIHRFGIGLFLSFLLGVSAEAMENELKLKLQQAENKAKADQLTIAQLRDQLEAEKQRSSKLYDFVVAKLKQFSVEVFSDPQAKENHLTRLKNDLTRIKNIADSQKRKTEVEQALNRHFEEVNRILCYLSSNALKIYDMADKSDSKVPQYAFSFARLYYRALKEDRIENLEQNDADELDICDQMFDLLKSSIFIESNHDNQIDRAKKAIKWYKKIIEIKPQLLTIEAIGKLELIGGKIRDNEQAIKSFNQELDLISSQLLKASFQ